MSNKFGDGLQNPQHKAYVAFFDSEAQKYVIADARPYQKRALFDYESSLRKSFNFKGGIKFDLEIHCPKALFKMIKEDGSVQYVSFTKQTLLDNVVNKAHGKHVYLFGGARKGAKKPTAKKAVTKKPAAKKAVTRKTK